MILAAEKLQSSGAEESVGQAEVFQSAVPDRSKEKHFSLEAQEVELEALNLKQTSGSVLHSWFPVNTGIGSAGYQGWFGVQKAMNVLYHMQRCNAFTVTWQRLTCSNYPLVRAV